VAGVVLLPVVVVSSAFVLATTWWRLRKLRKQLQGVGSRDPGASPHSEREVALCSFVRGLALDPEFSRDDALQAPVMASGDLLASDLLDEAQHRGWIVARGAGLTVTAEGGAAAETYLGRHGL
jgi:hypothetical protein